MSKPPSKSLDKVPIAATNHNSTRCNIIYQRICSITVDFCKALPSSPPFSCIISIASICRVHHSIHPIRFLWLMSMTKAFTLNNTPTSFVHLFLKTKSFLLHQILSKVAPNTMFHLTSSTSSLRWMLEFLRLCQIFLTHLQSLSACKKLSSFSLHSGKEKPSPIHCQVPLMSER